MKYQIIFKYSDLSCQLKMMVGKIVSCYGLGSGNGDGGNGERFCWYMGNIEGEMGIHMLLVIYTRRGMVRII